jgi:hypothetical protein
MKSNDLQLSEWLKHCENLYKVEKDFNQVIESMNVKIRDKKIANGKWSAKEILAHIVGWEVEVKKQFKVFLANPDVDDNYDIDSFNKSAVELRKYLSWDQIVTELKTAQSELSGFLTKLTQNEIDEEKRFIEWVDVLVNHYTHHVKQLKQLS